MGHQEARIQTEDSENTNDVEQPEALVSPASAFVLGFASMKTEELMSLFFSNGNTRDSLQKELAELEHLRVKIAVIGRSGTGKSSLINALYGQKVAATGATETTERPQEFDLSGLVIVDLPGCGTAHFPSATYLTDFQLSQYDAFVLVVAKRIYEDDLHLVKAISGAFHKKVHVVRSMLDQDVDNAARDGKTKQEVVTDVRSELFAAFGELCPCWLVSSVQPENFDFPEFEEGLLASLPAKKHDKYVYAAQAVTQKQLARKRKVAEKHVHLYAGLAAANGFNPIFGADIVADIAILLKMNHWILGCYKLDAENAQRIYGMRIDKNTLEIVLKKVLAFGTREFVLRALGKQATRITAMEVSKWVPVLGQMASAGLGFALARWMGLETIKKCEEVVQEIIELNLNQKEL